MEKLQDVAVRYLKGIGPKRAALFAKMGINTLEDLLYYFPRRYEDRSKFLPISQLKEGEYQTIKAEVLAKGEKQSWKKWGFKITEAAVSDDTGKIFCVWFNQPYLKDYLKVGMSLILYGKVERYSGRLQMNSPEFEMITPGADESLNIGKITPIYSLHQGITQRTYRQFIKHALDEYLPKLVDFIPFDIRTRNNLLNLPQGLLNIHFPQNQDMKSEAFRRISFEEFLLFQIPLALRKLKKKEKAGIAFNPEGRLARDFMNNLTFKLTAAQEKVIKEIELDMQRGAPMQRLLQGDVGSGKTVVAIVACLIACQNGYQAAFMVPTEILARQHFINIKNMNPGIKLALLIGSQSEKEKSRASREIKAQQADLVIGTHALLEEGVEFKKLGLVVIDEQHKFGVGQRALLPQKGVNPDCLIMTATPIPRTLAITIYGDLDISVINELPPGRLPVETISVAQNQIAKAYKIARDQLSLGHQAYVIYPVIEQSYALDIAGAKKMYESLKRGAFKEFRVGLIHGRLKQGEQDETMLKFKNKEIDILVATTVLEVGIDVANATCMIIEHADRFGLSQLHQLRGRIGRDKFKSFCILVADARTQEARMRQEAMVKYSDGFKIAEQDLKIRGPGEFFGSRQHGLTELKVANPLTQMQLLKRAREEAIKLVNQDPGLSGRLNSLLKQKVLTRFPEYEKLVVVG